MNGLAILLIALAALLAAYGMYGAWLARKWGVNPSRKTPAVELEDGRDYAPKRALMLMLRHVASTAGLGLIGALALASMYGWIPALVGVGLIVGLLGGTVCFAALFASVRHDGRGIGEVIEQHMSAGSRRAFLVLALVTALLTACTALSAATIGMTCLDGWPVEAFIPPVDWTMVMSAFGAALGFGVLVSAESAAKRVRSERAARRVGLGGAMLVAALAACALFALSCADAVQAGDPMKWIASGIASLAGAAGLAETTNAGYARIYIALCLTAALLCVAAVASSIRVCRMTIQAMAGDGHSKRSRALRSRGVARVIAVLCTALLLACAAECVEPLLGLAGLLTVAAAMTACAAWFKHIGRRNGLFIAMMIILFAAAAALAGFVAVNCVNALLAGEGALAVEGVQCAGVALLAALGAVIAVDGIRALRAKRA